MYITQLHGIEDLHVFFAMRCDADNLKMPVVKAHQVSGAQACAQEQFSAESNLKFGWYPIIWQFSLQLQIHSFFPGCIDSEYVSILSSTSPEHQMYTTVGWNHITDLSNFQSISSILKWFLHLTTPEPAKVTIMFMRGAIGVFLRQFRKFFGRPINLCSIASKDFDGFFFRTSDIYL